MLLFVCWSLIFVCCVSRFRLLVAVRSVFAVVVYFWCLLIVDVYCLLVDVVCFSVVDCCCLLVVVNLCLLFVAVDCCG